MNKILIILSFAILSFTKTYACDICGCGVGNFNPYMFPHLSRNFISVGYEYRHYSTHLVENGEAMTNNERYNTLSFTAQYSPVKNLQLMAILPYQINYQNGPEGNKSLHHIGDMILLGNYKLADHSSGTGKNMVRQTLLAGGGIKLPSGGFHFDESNETHVGNSNFQSGTGSVDYLLNVYYSLRYQKLAFNTGFNYKINTENKEGYQFGNRIQNVTQVKYIKELGSFSIIPSIGILSEKMQEDKQSGIKVDEERTGGYNIQALAGVDVNTQKWALGLNYITPLKQNLAAGQITAKPGVSIHLSYSF